MRYELTVGCSVSSSGKKVSMQPLGVFLQAYGSSEQDKKSQHASHVSSFLNTTLLPQPLQPEWLKLQHNAGCWLQQGTVCCSEHVVLPICPQPAKLQ